MSTFAIETNTKNEMAHTDTRTQRPAPVAIADAEWLKVINQQAASITRKNKQLARLKKLLAEARALNAGASQDPAGTFVPIGPAFLS